jgi:BASS family bile acid:Na+ symporter
MDVIVSIALPLGLAFIMFTLGLGLSVPDFTRILSRPAAFFAGALAQILLVPATTFAIITAFGITGPFAVGFMILSACPGGATSNVISKLAKADVALSVSLTAIMSLLSILTVPLIIAWSSRHFMGDSAASIDITRTAMIMFLLTALPIGLAMICRKLLPRLVQMAEPFATMLATLLFASLILGAIGSNLDLVAKNAALLGPAILIQLVTLMSLGFWLSRALGRPITETKTISIEVGIQNGSLGITIASILVTERTGFPLEAIPSAVYGIAMHLSLIPAYFWFRNMNE